MTATAHAIPSSPDLTQTPAPMAETPNTLTAAARQALAKTEVVYLKLREFEALTNPARNPDADRLFELFSDPQIKQMLVAKGLIKTRVYAKHAGAAKRRTWGKKSHHAMPTSGELSTS